MLVTLHKTLAKGVVPELADNVLISSHSALTAPCLNNPTARVFGMFILTAFQLSIERNR
jgi:hypothetical protein